MDSPKWSTPTRKDYLIKLWVKYGNQCLLGHTACPILEHYQHLDSRLVLVPQAKSVPCVDTHGNPLKDSQGNQLFITVYPIRKDFVYTKHIDRLYELKSESIIKDWIADDRKQAHENWKSEYELRHRIQERTLPLHGKFSGIAKDIYYDTQTQFFLEGLGISGLTFKPFAKLRLASSNTRLYVDIGDLLKPMSKNKRHKIVRHRKINQELRDRLDSVCWQAVKHYLSS